MAREADASQTTCPVTMCSAMPAMATLTPSTAVPSSATTVRRAGSRMPWATPPCLCTWCSARTSEIPSAKKATPSTIRPATYPLSSSSAPLRSASMPWKTEKQPPITKIPTAAISDQKNRSLP